MKGDFEMKDEKVSDNQGDIIIYQTEDGVTKIDVRFVDETVWLTQAQLVQLFQTSICWVCLFCGSEILV